MRTCVNKQPIKPHFECHSHLEGIPLIVASSLLNFISANIRTTITTRYLSSVDNTIIVRYLKRDRKSKKYDSNTYPEDGIETSNCSRIHKIVRSFSLS